MKDHAYICGLACVAKSSTLRTISQEYNISPEYTDYYELSQQVPEFKKKHQDSEVQIIYTINQVLKSTTTVSKIFDRSPISDLLYSLIFEEQNTPGLGQQKLREKLQWDLFVKTCERYPTLYILIENDDNQAEDDILEKMQHRNNGLDVLNKSYIVAQRTIFRMISENISNYESLIKPKHIKIHTQPYYTWLKIGVSRFLQRKQLLHT